MRMRNREIRVYRDAWVTGKNEENKGFGAGLGKNKSNEREQAKEDISDPGKKWMN